MKKIILLSVVILNLMSASLALAAVTRGDLKLAVSQCTKLLAQELVDQLATESEFKYVQSFPEALIVPAGVTSFDVTFSSYGPTVSTQDSFGGATTRETFVMYGSPFEIKINLSTNKLDEAENKSFDEVITLVSDDVFPSITFYSNSIVEVADRYGRPKTHLDLITNYEIVGQDIRSTLNNKDTGKLTHFWLDFAKYRACLKKSLEESEKRHPTNK